MCLYDQLILASVNSFGFCSKSQFMNSSNFAVQRYIYVSLMCNKISFLSQLGKYLELQYKIVNFGNLKLYAKRKRSESLNF